MVTQKLSSITDNYANTQGLFGIVLLAGLYFVIRYDMIVSGKTSFVTLFAILAAMLSLYKNGDIDINQYTLTGIILFGGILLLRLVYLFFKG